jgi:hypothetical protein
MKCKPISTLICPSLEKIGGRSKDYFNSLVWFDSLTTTIFIWYGVGGGVIVQPKANWLLEPPLAELGINCPFDDNCRPIE